MTQLTTEIKPASSLLLDPNNPRFQDIPSFSYAREDRYHEVTVQSRALERLKDESLRPLKSSIERSSFLPVEPLIVVPYEHLEDAFTIIDGNRRFAAVKWILDEYESGVDIAQTTLNSIQNLPVIVADSNDSSFTYALMGIRHVSGIKEWGGYQRAKLIVDMRDQLQLDAGGVAERLGLTTNEVNRRYRAYKALDQMKQDEDFSHGAFPNKYPIFHEALALPIVRDWLGWNEDESAFVNADELRSFYELINPVLDDEGNEKEAKITKYSHVRDLRKILPKSDAKRALFDPHVSFEEALAISVQDEISRAWATNVNTAILSLESMGVDNLKQLTPEDIQLLNRLKDKVTERLADHDNLS